jgi:hypothetical protein
MVGVLAKARSELQDTTIVMGSPTYSQSRS